MNSRMVGFGGAFGFTPKLRRALLRMAGASSGTVSTAGASGVSFAARAMSKTRQAVAASKARHLRRSSARSNLGVGLTCHALARCNSAILFLFRSCLRAFDEVLLTILLSLAGFCQRNQHSAAVAGARRTGWKGCSRPQNAAR